MITRFLFGTSVRTAAIKKCTDDISYSAFFSCDVFFWLLNASHESVALASLSPLEPWLSLPTGHGGSLQTGKNCFRFALKNSIGTFKCQSEF